MINLTSLFCTLSSIHYDHRLLMVELEVMFAIALICISPGYLKLNDRNIFIYYDDDDDKTGTLMP